MKPGSDIRVLVRDLDPQGDGVGAPVPFQGASSNSAEPVEVHVAGALPGEELSARIDSVSSHRPVAWATMRALHTVSPARVAPPCRAQGSCGGCVLQHCAVPAQVAWKESWLRGLIAARPELAGVRVAPLVGSPLDLGYRNNSKLVFAAATDGGPSRVVLGAYARRTHQVVDLAGCEITEPPLEQVAATLRELLTSNAIEPYDETRFTGVLRYVVLRSNHRGEVLATLVTSTDAFAGGEALAEELRARHANVVGIIQNVNPTRGNALYGARQNTLVGASTIEDEIGGVRLRISSRAFFQANRQVARAAYEKIRSAAGLTGTERVVDAFAGVGGIALTLAPHAHTVLGVEEHAGAVDDAQASAKLNDIGNATFVAGDVAEHLDAVGAADVVVLNPPRKGCAPRVLQQVVLLRPRTIAYLSCAAETLIRDLVNLAALNYRVVELTPFDMLPHTPHLETLAILTRALP